MASDALLVSLGVPDASTVDSDGDQLASNVVVISDDGKVSERIHLLEGFGYGSRSILPPSTARTEISRANLRISPTPGKGLCLFHAVRNHLMEFNLPTDPVAEIMKRMVDFFRYDPHGRDFKYSAMQDVNVNMILRCKAQDPETWPTIECFYAISNLYKLKVTVFVTHTLPRGEIGHGILEFWPIEDGDGPDYPPVPSAEAMAVKYEKQHFALLLPKDRGPKRKFSALSYLTPVKSGQPSYPTTRSCRCRGHCGTRTCSCIKSKRPCTTACHPGNDNCENHDNFDINA